jgi:ATP-dependent Clp protease protease subunit
VTGPFGLPEADGAGPESYLRRQLFDRRIVSLVGTLDDQVGNDVGVTLMTLDATGDEVVHLRIDSGGGTVGAALALMDIIGAAVGVLAACRRRRMAPHARIHLVEPSTDLIGSARQLEQLAAAHLDQWHRFCARLAELTGEPVGQVTEDAARGRHLSAEEAVAYGIADEVATPDAGMIRLPGRPPGFRSGG